MTGRHKMTEDEVIDDILSRPDMRDELLLAADSPSLLHFGLGMQVRNEYGLWNPGRWTGGAQSASMDLESDEPLAQEPVFERHPDDVSARLLQRALAKLREAQKP